MLIHGDKSSGVLLRGILPDAERRVVDLAPHLLSGRLERSGRGQVSGDTGPGAGRGTRRESRRSRGAAGRAGRRHAGRRDSAHARVRGGRHPLHRHVRIRSAHRHRGHAGCREDFAHGRRGHGHPPEASPTCTPRRGCRAPRPCSFGGDWEVQDWTAEHANFFRSISITKRILFFILSLMVAVAAFNIVSTMVMVVKDKRRDIAILRTFGSSPRSILSDIHRARQPDRAARHRRGRAAGRAGSRSNLQTWCTGWRASSGSSSWMRACTS